MRPWPQLYDAGNVNRIAILDDAYDVVVIDQILDSVGGEEILDFSMPLGSPKAGYIDNEMILRITEPGYVGAGAPVTAFAVRTKTETRDNLGNKTISVHAEALWYDLGAADPLTYNPGSTAAATVIAAVLAGTGWTVGTVTVGAALQPFIVTTPNNPLAILRSLPGIFGGELWFDNLAKTVNLVPSRGNPTSGLFFAYGKNLASSSRITDTAQLVSRLRPIGANGLDISLVNGGVTYIDDYTFYDSRSWPRQVKTSVLTNDQINNGAALMTWAQAQLATLSKPKFTYTLDVVVLNTESMPALGDTVRVWDKVLALDANARVAQRTINVMEPWRSTLQISTALYTLANAVGGAVQTTPGGGVPAPDITIPAAVAGVSAASIGTIDQNGNNYTQLKVTWTPVTNNVDGSLINDFSHYAVWYTLADGIKHDVGFLTPRTANSAMTDAVVAGATFTVSVAAVDTTGNQGAAGTYSSTVVNLAFPPPAPSTPVLDPVSLPMTIRATWNGLTNTGVAMPSDLLNVEVHASTTNGFTPSAATRVDSFTAAGVSPITGFDVGVTVYILFRAVGSTGLASTSSVVASSISQSVPDAKIGSLSAGKITTGGLFADLTLSARIKTADVGARVEMNATGIKAYNAGGQLTVDINSNGNASFTGTITGSSFTGGLFQTSTDSNIPRIVISGGLQDRIMLKTGMSFESDASTPLMYGNTTFVANLYHGVGISLQSGWRIGLGGVSSDMSWINIESAPRRNDNFALPNSSTIDMHTDTVTASGALSVTGQITMLGGWGVYSGGSPPPIPGPTQLVNAGYSGGNYWAATDVYDSSQAAWCPFFKAGGISGIKILPASGKFQFRDAADTTYRNCDALTFTSLSDRNVKRDITLFDKSATSLLAALPIYRYQFEDYTEPEDNWHLGPMWDESPAEIQSEENMLKNGSMIGLLIKAVQELTDRITELEGAAA